MARFEEDEEKNLFFKFLILPICICNETSRKTKDKCKIGKRESLLKSFGRYIWANFMRHRSMGFITYSWPYLYLALMDNHYYLLFTSGSTCIRDCPNYLISVRSFIKTLFLLSLVNVKCMIVMSLD